MVTKESNSGDREMTRERHTMLCHNGLSQWTVTMVDREWPSGTRKRGGRRRRVRGSYALVTSSNPQGSGKVSELAEGAAEDVTQNPHDDESFSIYPISEGK